MSSSTIHEEHLPLFLNHLAFLRTHRGRVTPDADGWRIESDRLEFTYGVLGSKTDVAVFDRFETVHLLPWSGEWQERLEHRGYRERGGFSYMVLAGAPDGWKRHGDLDIRCVSDAAGIDMFSEVQAKAFLETPEDYDSWHPWLRQANHANSGRPEQTFYVGLVEGAPAGAMLVVRDGPTMGVYAVATSPEFRRQGISATLLEKVIHDGREVGCTSVTLQAVIGSYAEAFYSRLGFRTALRSRTFRREALG